MTGTYKRKDGKIITVILTRFKGKEYYERGVYKDFGNRLFTKVTEEVIKQELETREIERI